MFYASIIFEIFAYKYDFFVQLVQSILKYNRGIYMQNVLLRLREVQPSLSNTKKQETLLWHSLEMAQPTKVHSMSQSIWQLLGNYCYLLYHQ